MYDAYTKKTLGPVGGFAGSFKEYIRANRAKLRDYLATAIDIKWGKRFVRYEIGSNGRVKAFFEDGSVAEGDILVGADGVRSPGAIDISLLISIHFSIFVFIQFATRFTTLILPHST